MLGLAATGFSGLHMPSPEPREGCNLQPRTGEVLSWEWFRRGTA